MSVKSKDDKRANAVESMVRDSIETIRKFGNVNTTEEQVRKEIVQIAENANKRMDYDKKR